MDLLVFGKKLTVLTLLNGDSINLTDQQKKDYWQVFDNFRKSRERKYAPVIQRILQQQKAEFIHKYKTGHLAGITLSPDNLYKAIKALYYDAGTTFGHKVLVSIKRQREQKARMPIGFNARMQQLIEKYYGLDFLTFSQGITDTTRDLLNAVLIKAQRDGLGFDDTIKLLEGTELSKARARLIARTETVTAANAGAQLAARDSGILVNKVWIATQDNRTRHDHYAVSSAAIGLDEAFNVGGYEMDHPGVRKQPDGSPVSPKEVCNCRCVVAHVPVRDIRGLAISN